MSVGFHIECPVSPGTISRDRLGGLPRVRAAGHQSRVGPPVSSCPGHYRGSGSTTVARRPQHERGSAFPPSPESQQFRDSVVPSVHIFNPPTPCVIATAYPSWDPSCQYRMAVANVRASIYELGSGSSRGHVTEPSDALSTQQSRAAAQGGSSFPSTLEPQDRPFHHVGPAAG